MWTRKSLRKMAHSTRELAKRVNALEAACKSLKRMFEAVSIMESDSLARYHTIELRNAQDSAIMVECQSCFERITLSQRSQIYEAVCTRCSKPLVNLVLTPLVY
jgi:hypothetical protein